MLPQASWPGVAGRHPTVIVTTGAVRALARGQLEAVLAHERAHLAWCHHRLMAMARISRRALPFLPLMRHAEAQLERLVELHADDAATQVREPESLATALVVLAAAAPEPASAAVADPSSALAAAGARPGSRLRSHGRGTADKPAAAPGRTPPRAVAPSPAGHGRRACARAAGHGAGPSRARASPGPGSSPVATASIRSPSPFGGVTYVAPPGSLHTEPLLSTIRFSNGDSKVWTVGGRSGWVSWPVSASSGGGCGRARTAVLAYCPCCPGRLTTQVGRSVRSG
jgi:Peptidase family M48